MDTTTRTDLHQVHSALFSDLSKLGQLIDPLNDRALATVHRALDHLRDLEAIIDPIPNTEFRKAQIEAGYSNTDVVDVLIDKLESAEAICDLMSVVAEAEHTEMGSDLCDTTMHRAAFTARNIVTECLKKASTWNAQHAGRSS